MKIAMITGTTGQDGSYLTELLLKKSYRVIGLVRRSSTQNYERIQHLTSNNNLELVECEISDSGSVYTVVNDYKPDEIYNLAAQSHVKTSFDQPDYTFQVNTLGVLNFLEAIRRFSPSTKFYQASTSEMFGKNYTEQYDPFDGRTVEKFQNETTEFMPQSPYAVAKLAAHNLVRIYREGYGIHASCGILFNHESERRGENFVTRKITKWIGEFYRWSQQYEFLHPLGNPYPEKEVDHIYIGMCPRTKQLLYFPKLRLGNLDAYRDWGHAEDYVLAMWLMLQQDESDDYVIATGNTYTIRNFLKKAFHEINIEDFKPYVVIDPKFYRPSEVEYLRGCSHKASDKLGWEPKIKFSELVKRMVWSDINGQKETQELQQEELL